MDEENELLKKRREKADLIKNEGIDLYPNDVRVANDTESMKARFDPLPAEELEKIEERFTLAGRIMAVRDFGKGAFVSIQDRKGRIQIFLRKNGLGEKGFALFKKLDAGDIIWVAGRVFKTKIGRAHV